MPEPDSAHPDSMGLCVTDALEPYRSSLEQLRVTEPILEEMLVDLAEIVRACRTWQGRSAERFIEFTALAGELEQEILDTLLSVIPVDRR